MCGIVGIVKLAPRETEEKARLQPISNALTGSMDGYPNEEGVLDFIAPVLPRIRLEQPDATFTVVGRNPSDRFLGEASCEFEQRCLEV